MDDFLQEDANDRIRKSMNARRETAAAQSLADDAKSHLCDALRAEKMAVVGLSEKVAALEYADRELFNYIRRLEFVQDGIWCNTCGKAKHVDLTDGPRPSGSIDSEFQRQFNAMLHSMEDDFNYVKLAYQKHYDELAAKYRPSRTFYENIMFVGEADKLVLPQNEVRATCIADSQSAKKSKPDLQELFAKFDDAWNDAPKADDLLS